MLEVRTLILNVLDKLEKLSRDCREKDTALDICSYRFNWTLRKNFHMVQDSEVLEEIT